MGWSGGFRQEPGGVRPGRSRPHPPETTAWAPPAPQPVPRAWRGRRAPKGRQSLPAPDPQALERRRWASRPAVPVSLAAGALPVAVDLLQAPTEGQQRSPPGSARFGVAQGEAIRLEPIRRVVGGPSAFAKAR
jgi:hypothetical protein